MSAIVCGRHKISQPLADMFGNTFLLLQIPFSHTTRHDTTQSTLYIFHIENVSIYLAFNALLRVT